MTILVPKSHCVMTSTVSVSQRSIRIGDVLRSKWLLDLFSQERSDTVFTVYVISSYVIKIRSLAMISI